MYLRFSHLISGDISRGDPELAEPHWRLPRHHFSPFGRPAKVGSRPAHSRSAPAASLVPPRLNTPKTAILNTRLFGHPSLEQKKNCQLHIFNECF